MSDAAPDAAVDGGFASSPTALAAPSNDGGCAVSAYEDPAGVAIFIAVVGAIVALRASRSGARS